MMFGPFLFSSLVLFPLVLSHIIYVVFFFNTFPTYMITHQLFLVLLAFILGYFFILLLFPLYYHITDVLASGLLNAFFYW